MVPDIVSGCLSWARRRSKLHDASNLARKPTALYEVILLMVLGLTGAVVSRQNRIEFECIKSSHKAVYNLMVK